MVLDIEQIEKWEHGTQVAGDPRGPWSQTRSGRKFYPLNPATHQLTIVDIAHQLALTNRFSGATSYHYSVAQHTLLVTAIVDKVFPLRINLRRWALLHDAPEYVLGDMVRPVKTLLPAYAEIEDRLMAVMARRFLLEPLRDTDAADLKYADNLACVIEKQHLLPNALDWHDMPTYVGGFEDYVVERGWRAVRNDLERELWTEFALDA